jgi:hypothetical protein
MTTPPRRLIDAGNALCVARALTDTDVALILLTMQEATESAIVLARMQADAGDAAAAEHLVVLTTKLSTVLYGTIDRRVEFAPTPAATPATAAPPAAASPEALSPKRDGKAKKGGAS